MKYGFIGCGNMGGALATAISKTTKDMFLADFDTSKSRDLALSLGVSFGKNEDVVQNCDRVFLGVKPQMMAQVLEPLRELIAEHKPTLISMAAGLSTDSICDMAGGNVPVIRIMPNTPVSVGKGVVLYCSNELVDNDTLISFAEDLKYAGLVDRLDESLIDAGCSVSGCGPAFMYMFAQALAQGGAECGLSYEKAVKYAAATMAGAAQMMLESDKTPDELRDAVCSKGGSTIEGVKVLEAEKLNETVISCVKASYKRNKELGK